MSFPQDGVDCDPCATRCRRLRDRSPPFPHLVHVPCATFPDVSGPPVRPGPDPPTAPTVSTLRCYRCVKGRATREEGVAGGVGEAPQRTLPAGDTTGLADPKTPSRPLRGSYWKGWEGGSGSMCVRWRGVLRKTSGTRGSAGTTWQRPGNPWV